MRSIHEVRTGEGHNPFLLAGLEDVQRQVKISPRDRGRAVAQAAVAPRELNLTGMQVLAGMVFGICLVTLFVWGFVRHLLFAQ